MASTNVRARNPRKTHEGATAYPIKAEQELRRSVMACLLWESQFYEDGQSIADRIKGLVSKVMPHVVADIAREARNEQHLRHVPLLLARELARMGYTGTRGVLADIIQRPDELTEFLSLYWQDGRQPVSAQVKKGLALAFTKFSAYQLAKYNRDDRIKLRDVLFLSHAKPKDNEQAQVWKQLVDGTLASPDTWEVSLSAGKDKRETWERLINEKKLGGLATLRNLRNMQEVGVPDSLIRQAITQANYTRVLPFRFIAAARYAPRFEPVLEEAMFKQLSESVKLPGHTVVLVDVSYSMDAELSGKSDMKRIDAACGVAMILREICEEVSVFSFSMQLVEIPAHHGFALRDAINGSQEHNSTPLGLAIQSLYADKSDHIRSADFGYYGSRSVDYIGQALSPARTIVITDEQSADKVQNPKGLGYMLNVASYQNGIGYGKWTHIDGWSEAVFKYIMAVEHVDNKATGEETENPASDDSVEM